jgi:hypothetical protein
LQQASKNEYLAPKESNKFTSRVGAVGGGGGGVLTVGEEKTFLLISEFFSFPSPLRNNNKFIVNAREGNLWLVYASPRPQLARVVFAVNCCYYQCGGIEITRECEQKTGKGCDRFAYCGDSQNTHCVCVSVFISHSRRKTAKQPHKHRRRRLGMASSRTSYGRLIMLFASLDASCL